MHGAKIAVPRRWINGALYDILLPAVATIDTDQLAVFVAVVRAGSFTAAAQALGTQKAHVSRVVSRLERQLSVRLLQRSTRSLAVTEVGRDLYERASTILTALEDTATAIQGTQGEPQGVLKLTCGVEFGMLVVSGWVSEYLKAYPRVRVDIELGSRLVDLIYEGFDLAIRVGSLSDSGLSAHRLGEVHYALYASPDYLRAHTHPAHPSDLAQHHLVMFAVSRPPVWRLINGAGRFDVSGPARLVLNNNIMASEAAAAGLGIALLPRFQAAPFVTRKQLVEVLNGWTRAPVPVHALFASSRYLAPKVRTFIDFARTKMPDL
jgi:DNA-binding transcriptional LysR family regulator